MHPNPRHPLRLRRHLVPFAGAILGVLLPLAARAATYSLPPAADTWFDVSNPENNYGSADVLEVFGSKGDLAFLRFDVSSLGGGETVVSATLHLWVTRKDDPGSSVRVFRVSEPWTEGTVTWDTASESVDSTTTWASFSATVQDAWITADLTDLVRAWAAGVSNDGVALMSNMADGNTKYSSREEAVPGQRPYLEIQTTSPLGLADLAVSKSVDMNTPAVGDSVQ
ncbi:DNRLRE domain-containing protein, partial [bacterium]|nr:DNRLRE domain-containing protein [bacterium]